MINKLSSALVLTWIFFLPRESLRYILLTISSHPRYSLRAIHPLIYIWVERLLSCRLSSSLFIYPSVMDEVTADSSEVRVFIFNHEQRLATCLRGKTD